MPLAYINPWLPRMTATQAAQMAAQRTTGYLSIMSLSDVIMNLTPYSIANEAAMSIASIATRQHLWVMLSSEHDVSSYLPPYA
eukprot:185059-Prymnesium_polylepis.2